MSNFLYLFLIISIITNAQTFGPQQIISTDGDGPQSVFVADLDGDLYADVMSANKFGSNLTWHKNLGDGTFGPQQIIADLNQPKFIFAADLDGDFDMDILATGLFIDELVWYKNVDGLGAFGSKIIITNELDGPYAVIANDIDGDGDMDVICGSESSGLAWFENLDGNGNFSTKKTINASLPNARSVMAIDMDGDNDLDVVSSSSGSVTVSWYENLDGQGSFGPQRVIAGSALTVQGLYVADLDGDLDNDVIAATPAMDKVVWFQNLDGLGNFGDENVFSLEAEGVSTLFAADIDNDNDIDVLYRSTPDVTQETSEVLWSENLDGIGTFSPKKIIDNTLQLVTHVIASDIDNDGDMDIFAASQNNDKVVWYENLTILDTDTFLIPGLKVYPNPVKEVLIIESPVALQKVVIFSVLGRKLLEVTEQFNEVSIATLPSGLLLVEVQTEKGKVVQKIVKK